MSYKVVIRENATGEMLTRHIDLDWDDGSVFWWSEGNMACDCNRKLEFYRAKGIELGDAQCGDGAYTVIKDEHSLPSSGF